MNTESRLVKAALASIQSGKPESVCFDCKPALDYAFEDFRALAIQRKSIFSGPVRLSSEWSFPFDDGLLTLRGLAAGTDVVLWTVLVRYDEETVTA